jgi:2-polyprenyl-6-methoxyphenol hydroxylase-like FAD-dependent oxidoreductase
VSAHGLSAALRDAELCARAIDSALIDPGSTTTALTRYHLVRDQLSGRMLDLTSALASYDWDAGTASQLMRDISDSVKDECTMITELGDWRAISSPSIARTSAAFG